MTVIGQNKIIYMPYMPPFTRSEEMADYTNPCKPVEWRHGKIRSLDGTKLSICVGEIPPAVQGPAAVARRKSRHIVIVHFHGNGGSLPPRLPLMSRFLKAIRQQADTAGAGVKLTMVALSPRGYWKSSGRASQKGIERDAQALLRWIPSHLKFDDECELELILWGQSLGAGVATTATATYLTEAHNTASMPTILGLLLETPFTSIESMLLTLYPQKWLPYRRLHPFLWNHWDSRQALATIGKHFTSPGKASKAPKVLLMIAEKDEVVPAEEGKKLEEACEQAGLDWQRKDAAGALHVDALAKSQGRDQAVQWILEVVEAKRVSNTGSTSTPSPTLSTSPNTATPSPLHNITATMQFYTNTQLMALVALFATMALGAAVPEARANIGGKASPGGCEPCPWDPRECC
ncbi:unnamed protein product [Zymoseptoria tritici ST99CH_1A5]|uniref:AB hydrolase-1 domain-containing protein n=1 Tax=Zymoseptoria tritici ST99CH_1A5 TaxID=1276529 RepID=A0A1Y6LFU2_ZYMTR|nr:unnamed protein product [Zymoseptoria tritici ST99CH_1A5]